MDKIILVFYVNISNIVDLPRYIQNINESIRPENGEYLYFIIPSHNESTVECINPKFLNSQEEYEKILERMKEVETHFKKFIENNG